MYPRLVSVVTKINQIKKPKALRNGKAISNKMFPEALNKFSLFISGNLIFN